MCINGLLEVGYFEGNGNPLTLPSPTGLGERIKEKGVYGGRIDHVELYEVTQNAQNNQSRNTT